MRIGKLLSSIFLFISLLIVFPNSTVADPLDSWHLRYSSTPKFLHAVAYGNGTFVAVGDEGTILNSVDGITWGPKTSGTSMDLYGVTYGNSTFVAVGDHGTILISPDGGTWTPRTPYSGTTEDLNAIAYGNGIFVAVGDYKTVLTSPDGYTWAARTLGTFSTFPDAVCFGNGTFVSVGVSGVIFISTNGLTWTEIESPNLHSLFGVAYGNDIFVAVGWDGTVLTSPDGIIWTERNSGTSKDFDAVAYGNNTFVTVGDDLVYGSIIFTSPDGVVWTQRNSGTDEILDGVTYGEGTFVAVGSVILQSDLMSFDIFSDVAPDYWAYDYIASIYNVGITKGCAQDDPNTPENERKYCPEDYVTREQMAAFIVRAVEGEPPENYCDTGDPFPDVTPDMFFCRYIKRLYELEITTGYRDGTYGPQNNVSREEMAAFLVRAVEGEPPTNYCDSGSLFPDVTPDMWSCRYIKRLKELEITTGYKDGTYGPYDLVTRDQMAAFLSRAFLGME